jgi:hypothetical protein
MIMGRLRQLLPKTAHDHESALAVLQMWCSTTYSVDAEDRWMPSLATAEGSGPAPDIPRR